MGEIVKINKVNFSQVIGKEKPLDKETQKRKLMVKNENLGKKKQNVALKNEKISSEKTPQKRFYKAKAKTNNS